MSARDERKLFIFSFMFCIALINAERSVFDSLNDRPTVFTMYACDNVTRQRLTFDSISAAEEAAKAYASKLSRHEYVALSPSLDIIEHARNNEGTTFVQVDFDSSL